MISYEENNIISIDSPIPFVKWMKTIFVEDPYWRVIPGDICRQEKINDHRDDLIFVKKICQKRIQWIGYTFGVAVSGCYYEIRFNEYFKPKTSSRLILSPNLTSFIEWINNNWIKLTYTKSKDSYSFDFKTINNQVNFIKSEWWSLEQRINNIIYHRFSPYDSKDAIARQYYEEAKKEIINFFTNMFGEIDVKDFLYYFQKGVDCIPINIPEEQIIKVKWSSIKTKRRINKFINDRFPNIDSSSYENDVLRNVIDQARKYLCHDINNSGFYKYILIDSVMWRPLDKLNCPYIAIEINKKAKDDKGNFSKNDKKIIFKEYGYKVFNNNHCFNRYRSTEIYVVKDFCEYIYGTDERWMNYYGGKQSISDILGQYNSEFLTTKFKYKKRHTIEINHFPLKDTIIKLKHAGYPKYDLYLAIPIFSYDHAKKLSKCKNEEDQLNVFLDEGWMTINNIKDFCNKIMNRVIKIEKERDLGSELSNILKKQFNNFFRLKGNN